MGSRKFAVFGPRLMLATMLATLAGIALAQAQEGTDKGLEPGVETATVDNFEAAVDTSDVPEDSRDEIEPGVSTSVLAADVTRQESGRRVMDRLELGRTEITGNQELPKVLYIVPWKKSDPGDLLGRPVNTLLDEVLAPLDREEFVRQVNYYGDLYGDE